jgi:hypothetical protein
MTLDPCAKQNLRIKRGTLLAIDIVCTNEANQPLSMTGRTCKMQARASYGGPVLFEAVSPTTITLTTGLVSVEIVAPASTALVTGVYDIILTGPDGPECIAEGAIEITDKATAL